MNARRVAVAGGVVVLVVALGLLLRGGAVPVETATVTRGPLRVTLDGEGRTRVRERYVVAAPVAGRLERITLREGDAVRRGEILARLAPAPLDPRDREQAEARLAAAEDARRAADAALAQAGAALDQATRRRERAERLAAESLVAVQDREEAELLETTRRQERDAADFRVQVAAHDVELARAVLAGGLRIVVLRAPVAGRVLRVPEASERVVAPGAPVIEIGDPAALEVVVDYLSSDAVQIAAGDTMLVEAWGGSGALLARVRRVEPSAFTKVSALGVEEQRVNVIGDLTAAPPALGDGFRVEARVVVWSAPAVLTVPASALFRRGERWTVFTVAGGRARARAVTIGHRTAFDAEVLEGLAAGDRVIRNPSDRIADGVRVALP